jgi:lantibiotic modifying enzyme
MTEPTKALRPIFGPYEYVQAAEAVAAFLEGIVVPSGRGVYWPPQPEVETSKETASVHFYNGNAGQVYFLTQLYRATKNQAYLDRAREGALFIIDEYPGEIPSIPGAGSLIEQMNINSIGGIAFALAEFVRIAPDPKVDAFVRRLIDEIIDLAQEGEDGLFWTPLQATIGEWGTILFLLYAAERYDEPAWRTTALRAGETVLALGEPVGDGLRFNGAKKLFSHIKIDAEASIELPNFEFGTAGASYTLARLYEASGETRFLDAAKRGASYVRSLAVEKDGGALVPYRLPDLSDVFYLGFCHGPAGTGRLYYKLYELTGKQEYREFLDKLVRGLELAGAPENHSHGYWHVFSQCCGTAAQTEFFLGLWAAFGEERHLELAQRAGRHILGAAAAFTERTELKWYQAFERINPAKVTLDAGYLSGVAGIGAALLRLGLADEGRFEVLRFFDDPFPTAGPRQKGHA